jgi:hypothetical protein
MPTYKAPQETIQNVAAAVAADAFAYAVHTIDYHKIIHFSVFVYVANRVSN